ncbi:serine/threonine protein kinase [Radiobacillus sp. PE A8.2]|uniref:serine/threonine protein kinase n=1 Tax=Radiobacillus sp. PE A8.2 TaxID=3380349 RepID=UPI003890A460
MKSDWEDAIPSLSEISITSNPNNQPVTIHGSSPNLRCVGVGTDAAVFQYIHTPVYAFKIYAADKTDKIKVEAEVYRRLGESPFFPTCYAANDQYLVLSFEQGTTLFDCLLQGIHIPQQVVQDVDEAREYARQRSLNPRDIHLKNILLQNGRAKIIDVSEYVQPGNDYRWEHTKKAYQYYHLIDGKSVPFWLVETVRKWYHQRNSHFASFDEFIESVLKLTAFRK